jgi:transglutaminase-like putative cysteine protease
MKYNIVHITRYFYTEAATLCHNQAHLTPRETDWQKCIRCKLDINPAARAVQPWTDAFGNTATYFSIEQSHRELSVVANSQVEVLDHPSPSDLQPRSWEQAVAKMDSYEFRAQHELTALLCRSKHLDSGIDVYNYGAQSFSPGRPLFEAVLELTERIHADFQYDPAVSSISTPPSEILRRRRGVCQDFAHLQIDCLRSLGLAARYVSGYLVTQPPPGKPRLVGADATHAWVSVYFPERGWVDYDPTNRQLTNADYITLAWGRDYADVAPIHGVFLGGGAHSMAVSVDVALCEI